MAIYSLDLGFVSRTEGRSSIGFAAYISGSKGYDQRTGVAYNYSNKKEVIHSRILAPEGSPEWAKNPHTLWNKVEAAEEKFAASRFKNEATKEKFLASAQTAQTVMGAIPIELTKEQAEACVEEFLNERFVSRGLVLQYGLHWDRGNPHFHAQVSRRYLVDNDLSHRKDRDIVSKPELKATRKAWELIVNKHLALAGHEVRIDCRSKADQGSLFMATRHEGWYAQHLAKQGKYSHLVAENDQIRQHNLEIMCEKPEALIYEVSLKRTTFTRKHIEDEIIRRVGGDEKLFAILMAQVNGIEIPSELILQQSNDDIVYESFASDVQKVVGKLTDKLLANRDVTHRVGENLDHNIIYTSTQYKQQEEKLTQYADTLNHHESKVIESEKINNAIQSLERTATEERGEVFQFFPEQSQAIHHLCSGPDIRILNGKAGTGKTTLLKAVAEIYAQEGYRVLGTSFQGKAVEIMEQEIGIPCRTLHSLTHAWEKYEQKKALVDSGKLWGRPLYYAIQQMKELEQHRFTNKDVIIVDEANMIGGSLWEPFLKEASSQGAKVLIVQDSSQIKSRDPGDYGRIFAQMYGACETTTVVRQKVDWQRACSELLNDHHVLDGLMPYYEKGHIQWFETDVEVREQLIRDYLLDLKTNPDQTRMVLAYRNSEVYDLNQDIRQALIAEGNLTEHFEFAGREYSIGDQILFTENDNHSCYVKNEIKTPQDITLPKGIKNGSFGTIVGYDTGHESLKVRLHKDNRIVHFTAAEYPHITLGYAMSIHKSEGSTFDQTFVSPDVLMDPTTTLVSMTRHRHNTRMYVNREYFIDFKHLVDQLSYGGMRETLQDYQISEEQQPYLERVQQYIDLIFEANTLREEVESILKPDEGFHKHPSYEAYQLCLNHKKGFAAEILKNWDSHLPYVRLVGLRRDVLEVDAGQRPRLLSDLEYRASIQVQAYMEVTKQTKSLWATISAPHPGSFAPSHELYAEYKALKAERDSLASVFHENPKLYRQFFICKKEHEQSDLYINYWGDQVEDGSWFPFSAIKKQAKTHDEEQHRNLHFEKLSHEQQEDYKTVESYLTARNQAVTAYGHLKKLENDAVQISSTIQFTQEKFKERQSIRDQLALKIIDLPETYKLHLDQLKIDQDKLLLHAQAGDISLLIQTYLAVDTIAARAHLAEKLQSLPKETKAHQLMKEEGIDRNRLTFDIAFYRGILSGEISPDTQPDQVYKPIKDYLDRYHDAARLWNIIQAKDNERNLQTKPMERMNQSPLKVEWQQALQARNENAVVLLQNKVASLVLMEMKPGIESRLVTHAEKAISRQEQLASVPIHPPGTAVYKNTPQTFIPAEKVIEAAKGRYADIVTKLLGNPNQRMSSCSALRFGKLGEVVFSIAGSKEGLWHDFSTGEGGNIFHLIQREKNLDFKSSVEYHARELNINSYEQIHHHQQPPKRNSGDYSIEDAKDIKERLAAVQELLTKSNPIQDTIAEQYLRQERGIQGQLPDDLRYIPEGTTFTYKGDHKTLTHDCFVAFGKNQEGDLSVVQVAKLNPDGTRARTKSGEKLNKLQYGISKGSFVTLQEGTDRVFIAEGLETALSIKEAGVTGKIVASLGVNNMTNYSGPEEKIILCADNDDHNPKSRTHEMVTKVHTHLKDQGYTVEIIKPITPGQDFNDVLKKQGITGVTQYVKAYTDDPICKLANHFEGLFKQIREATDDQEREKLVNKLDRKLKLFEEDPSIIAEIKVVNPVVGEKLEKLHTGLQELQKQQEIQRSASKGMGLSL